MRPIDVNPHDLEIVRAILRRHVPDRAVIAFGSRVTWTAKEFSDLDLAVMGDEPVPHRVLGAMADEFDESDLPFKVDIVDWATTGKSFRKIIERDGVLFNDIAESADFLPVPLGEIAEIFDGPHATPPKTSSGPVFLGISNLAHGRLDLSETEHVSESDFERWTRRVEPQAGDVVFSYETRLGEAALIPKGLRCCLGRRMGLLRAKPDKVDQRFLLYAYLGPAFQETLRAHTVPGSTVDRIPLIEMPNFLITIPRDIGEQRAIAHILGALDDKIELNRRMSETLEAMARALFKSWFVDFDPARAKAEGRETGLPEEIAASFPARVVDSELGKIPDGWRVVPAGDVFDVAIGKTPPRKEHHWFSADPQDIPWMSIKDLGQAGVYISQVSEYLTPVAVERFRVRRIPDGTVVLSFKLTVGRVAITDGEMLSNEAIAHFLPRETTFLSAAYVYCYLRQFDYGSLGSTSSIATAVNSDSVRAIPLLVPSKEVHESFLRVTSPLFQRLRAIQRESHTLAALRDTLLPKLISGEIRVKDAERFAARAGAL